MIATRQKVFFCSNMKKTASCHHIYEIIYFKNLNDKFYRIPMPWLFLICHTSDFPKMQYLHEAYSKLRQQCTNVTKAISCHEPSIKPYQIPSPKPKPKAQFRHINEDDHLLLYPLLSPLPIPVFRTRLLCRQP